MDFAAFLAAGFLAAAALDVVAAPGLASYFLRNLSTRPCVSTSLYLPVKKGWQLEQISMWKLPRVERVRISFPQAHWLAAALWRMQGMHDEAANALAYLQKRVPELSAGNLAWMILALREGGLPAADETVRAALIRMVELRDPAGHWPSDEGAGNAVHVTIEAIKSLQLAGNLS